jgi:DNA-directed RNA polymerase specialized sigma24 family protein
MNWDKFIEDTMANYTNAAYSMLNDEDDVKDVVQQTYMDLFITHGRYERLRAAGAVSVYNKARNMIKYRKPFERINQHEWAMPSYEIADDGQFVEELLKFVPKDKEMLMMSAHGYSIWEIAEKNNLSHGYARRRIAKARRRLRRVAKLI